MMEPAEEIGRPLPRRRYVDPRYRDRGRQMTELAARRWASRAPQGRVRLRTSQIESIGPGDPQDSLIDVSPGGSPMMAPASDGEYWTDEGYPGPPPGDGPYIEGYPGDGAYIDGYQGDCGGCGHCSRCRPMHHRLLPCICDWIHGASRSPATPQRSPYWRNFSTYSGAQGFKAPPDLGMNGNFGFNKGVNWAMPLLRGPAIGLQAGTTIALSDFDGSTGLVNHSRTQIFATGGLFHRAPCNRGFQGGAALDYLYDSWYVRMNLTQVRAELSYLWGFHEIGVWAAAHTNSDTQPAPSSLVVPTVTWQTTDQYNLYYRANFSYGAVGRMWVGLSGHGDVLFGGDATAPLSERWAIQIAQNYLLPRNNSTVPGAVKESWGLTLAMIWYPAAKTPNHRFDPYRPLFSVADNTWMFTRMK